jgi:hypothetical protein
MITTITGAAAAVKAVAALRSGAWGVAALQDYFPQYQLGAAPTVEV